MRLILELVLLVPLVFGAHLVIIGLVVGIGASFVMATTEDAFGDTLKAIALRVVGGALTLLGMGMLYLVRYFQNRRRC